MAKIYMVFGFHCHQPWWQFDDVMERVHRDCYLPLSRWLAGGSAPPLLFHLSGSLVELCEKHGFNKFLTNVWAARNCWGRLTLVGGAYHHPILPLIPREEAVRQVALHRQKYQEVFRSAPEGFFPPEMAYAREVAELAMGAQLGWVLADDLPYSVACGHAPRDYVPVHAGVPVLLRSRLWSNRVAFNRGGPEALARWMVSDLRRSFPDRPQYVFLMMDGEAFGGHLSGGGQPVENLLRLVGGLRAFPGVEFVRPAELLELFPQVERAVPAGSWSTSAADLAAGKPFPLWADRDNPAHRALWDLVRLAYQAFVRAGRPPEFRVRVDRAWNSCKWWWVAGGRWEPSLVSEEVRNLLAIIGISDDPEVHRRREEVLLQLQQLGFGIG